MAFGDVINSFACPTYSYGICTDGKDLFLVDPTPVIYHYDKIGNLINTIAIGNWGGIEFDGKYFWILVFPGGGLRQVDRGGNTIKTVASPVPATQPSDLCFDRKNFYGSEPQSGNLYHFDKNGVIIRRTLLPTNEYAGITTDRKHLYIFHNLTNTIDKFDKNGVFISSCGAPGAADFGPMCFDGKYIWFVDEQKGVVYQIATG